MTAPADRGRPALDWSWVERNADLIGAQLLEHVELTAAAVGIGLLVALPLAVVARSRDRLYGALLGLTGLLFTIPSLALFVLMVGLTGLSRTTALVPLTIYTLLILLRNAVTGLRAVDRGVVDSADAMGYRPARRLLAVELPLALPTVVAGVRIAAVTIIGLVTVTALVGQGGLGQLMLDGFQRRFATPLVVGITLSVALAVVADLLLAGAQRLATPWARRES